MNVVGTRLRELRQNSSMTQEQLAHKLSEITGVNISTRTVSGYETGTREPDIRTLVSIASYFNISLDWLLGISNRMERASEPAPDKKYLSFPEISFMIRDFSKQLNAISMKAEQKGIYFDMFSEDLSPLHPYAKDYILHEVKRCMNRCDWFLENIDSFKLSDDCFNGDLIERYFSRD